MKKLLFIFFVCILHAQIKTMDYKLEFTKAINNADLKKIQKFKPRVPVSLVKAIENRFKKVLEAEKKKLFILENKEQLTDDEIKEIANLQKNITVLQAVLNELFEENMETDTEEE